MLTSPELEQMDHVEQEAEEPPAFQDEILMVDVKGQVKKPGVYETTTGERVVDVINRAGGMTEKADKMGINLAEHVQDAMVIYVPAIGEDIEAESIPVAGNGIASSSGEAKININTADEVALQNLPGIGPSKAAAIVEYRDTNGKFSAIEDLKNITGIGDKTFEKLADLITVD